MEKKLPSNSTAIHRATGFFEERCTERLSLVQNERTTLNRGCFKVEDLLLIWQVRQRGLWVTALNQHTKVLLKAQLCSQVVDTGSGQLNLAVLELLTPICKLQMLRPGRASRSWDKKCFIATWGRCCDSWLLEGNCTLSVGWLNINLFCLINYQQCTHFTLHSACFCDPGNTSVRKTQLWL